MSSPVRLIEDFHRVALAANIDYLIIGGFAASFWGTPRFTSDVDVALRKSDFERAKAVVESIGYVLEFLHPNRAFAHFSGPHATGLRLDFMLVDDRTWSQLAEGTTFGDLGGTTNYPIVSALHLIAMKLHAAKQPHRTEFHKDLNDIVETMLAQKIELEDLEKQGIIQKHGTEQTIARLRDMLDARRKVGGN